MTYVLQTDRQTDRQIERQTDRDIHTEGQRQKVKQTYTV